MLIDALNYVAHLIFANEICRCELYNGHYLSSHDFLSNGNNGAIVDHKIELSVI